MSQFRRPGWSGWWRCDRNGDIVPDPSGPPPHRVDPNWHPPKPEPEPKPEKPCPRHHDISRMRRYGADAQRQCLDCIAIRKGHPVHV